MKSVVWVVCLALGAVGVARAGDMPPPEFFAGRYDIIGRWEAPDGAAQGILSGQGVLTGGPGLEAELCGLGHLQLEEGGLPEDGPMLVGKLPGGTLSCAAFVAPGNSPFLACRLVGDRRARFALWYRSGDMTSGPPSCSN